MAPTRWPNQGIVWGFLQCNIKDIRIEPAKSVSGCVNRHVPGRWRPLGIYSPVIVPPFASASGGSPGPGPDPGEGMGGASLASAPI